ncbi:hypothetical protein KI688_006471 [Linnemannia hyalina]|uniref:Uncharacterized protein n=1 Tax=Linnemannia hyalina TaxID=64524 RepID=A0A9P8BMW3_9FUNG|nr:hypothetical protein KI688_006471 [Linnemannia hyalina]
MFGDHNLVLKEVDTQLVEHTFSRIKIFQGHAVAVIDEPFVSKAVENYFTTIDPYFAREVRKCMPSGPDLVFFIRIDGARLVPVFVQMKLRQGSSNFSEKDWNDALSTVSALKIEGYAIFFRKYCPDNVYISMIVAYPTKWTDKLPAPSELPKDPSGVQQVVINVSDDNFGDFFPKEHVEFIDRLKDARKPSADDEDSSDEDCPKKQRS